MNYNNASLVFFFLYVKKLKKGNLKYLNYPKSFPIRFSMLSQKVLHWPGNALSPVELNSLSSSKQILIDQLVPPNIPGFL